MGRSVSIAIPCPDPDNSELLAGGEFAAVLAESVKWSARPEPDPRFSGRIERSERRAIVSIRASDSSGAPMNMLELFVRTRNPEDDTTDKTPMEQEAPGRYVAQLDLEQVSGGVDIVDSAGAMVWRTRAVTAYRREFDAIGPNYANLRRLASLTAGQLVRLDELAEIAGRTRRVGRWEIWPWLAGLALTLMLLDWLGAYTFGKSGIAKAGHTDR